MKNNEFEIAFNEIAELRALPQEIVLGALQTALISAYRRDSNASAAQRVEATIDPTTGRARIYVEKEVVEEIFNPNTEVDLEKARFYHPECDLGDTVMVQVESTTKKFGRIAAQTAKQVILQKIREAERNALYDEYVEKEGDIINGQVQSTNPSVVTLSLGRAEAILPRAQQIPGERYRAHDKIRCYVLEVKRSSRGPQIIVSRSHRNMLRRLLEFEVPEIYNGQIEIKNIAREAGYRSKVAVVASQEGIDPVGACVGMRGIRIQNIVKELHDEKIDVIEWNPKQELFIEKALSPARVTGVYLDDDPDAGRTAVVIVPDDQLSLAIGREGQNARLAAKLTGWRIDIKSVTEAVMNAFDNLDQPPLTDLTISHADMLAEVGFVMEKKQAGRAIMPEEYRALNQFADLIERRLQAERDKEKQARIAEINAVKATLPQFAFDIPVIDLDLPDHIIEALQPLDNVGEIMLRFLIDEKRLRRLLGSNSDEALIQVQTALDKLVMPDESVEDDDHYDDDEDDEFMDDSTSSDDFEPEEEVEELSSSVEESVKPLVSADQLSAFPQPIDPEDEAALAKERRRKAKAARPASEGVDEIDEVEYLEDDFLDEDGKSKGKGKRNKEKQKRRQLIYDEDRGQTVARRRRKGSRKRDSWDEETF